MLRSLRLRKQDGVFRAEKLDDWRHHWREPYHLMLAIPWPGFVGLIAASYLVLNLVFALLFLLDPGGIGGVPGGGPAGFAEAFFFSVQTLGSIGYGVLHPASLWVNLVVTLEALGGLIFIAVTTGLAFARFSRSRARILFSTVATVEPWNGVPTLTFRIANVRRNGILDGRMRLYLALEELSSEGFRLRRLVPLTLLREQSIHFQLMWTLMHTIDDQSPLQGHTAESLAARHGELLAAFQGVDETLQSPVHARWTYRPADLRLNARFADIVVDDEDSRVLDFSRFNETVPCSACADQAATNSGSR
ncbi:ion channel [Cyanobium sp. Morenito 9A2]|uniref:ion channel n=1 Tax=Cyanobium sp. Morenito 9A2 TaxID=2823718 RepID=UPI0020CC9D75|nr:ion channel [Cyanobium sp. Morenito 9A2]